jgi:hypothetical protein
MDRLAKMFASRSEALLLRAVPYVSGKFWCLGVWYDWLHVMIAGGVVTVETNLFMAKVAEQGLHPVLDVGTPPMHFPSIAVSPHEGNGSMYVLFAAAPLMLQVSSRRTWMRFAPALFCQKANQNWTPVSLRPAVLHQRKGP